MLAQLVLQRVALAQQPAHELVFLDVPGVRGLGQDVQRFQTDGRGRGRQGPVVAGDVAGDLSVLDGVQFAQQQRPVHARVHGQVVRFENEPHDAFEEAAGPLGVALASRGAGRDAVKGTAAAPGATFVVALGAVAVLEPPHRLPTAQIRGWENRGEFRV